MTNAASSDVRQALATLVRELVDGAGEDWCWVLNPKDPGLLRSLETLSAADASAAPPNGGPSIAAHVDHLRYGLQLLNRWNQGDDPFGDANYAASWRRTSVDEDRWRELRDGLRHEARTWLRAIEDAPRPLDQVALTGTLAGAVHLAYHVGAIRQVNRDLRGPEARD
jgi:hypothetical protein